MRPLLLAVALLPLAAQAHDEHEHGSLGKHEHGVAQLNVALDGKTLELQVDSPAMTAMAGRVRISAAATANGSSHGSGKCPVMFSRAANGTLSTSTSRPMRTHSASNTAASSSSRAIGKANS